jgi:ABC-2 type transport system permease protein
MKRHFAPLPTLLRMGFAEAVAYRSEMFVWFLSTNTPLIMLLMWSAVAAEAPVGRYGEREFTAYFLTTLVVRLLTGAWVVWEMNMEIRGGQLGMRLLRPVHPFVAYAAENLGAWPMRALIVVPIIAVAALVVGPDGFSHDPRQWGLVPLVVAGAWALTFAAMLALGSLGLYVQSSLALFDVWLGLYFVLSGYVVPLDLFPEAMRGVVEVLPFRYLLGFPVETVLGTLDFETTLVHLGRQWGYAAGFLALALVLWKRGLRGYEAFGG